MYDQRRSRWPRGANEWVCGSWKTEIACSNSAGGMDVSLVNVLFRLIEVSVTRRSLVQRSPTECVCVTEYDQVQQLPSIPTTGQAKNTFT